MIKLLPEWIKHTAILLALPHEGTDWAYMLDDAIMQYKAIIDALSSNNINTVLLCDDIDKAKSLFTSHQYEFISFVQCSYNDTWTRDYGPISVIKDDRYRALDFGFNGWGLKFAADKDNLVNLRLKEKGFITSGCYRNERDFILEGGSIETDGRGTILTTSHCLCSPNRNGGLSKQNAIASLTRRLGAEHVLMLDYGHLAGDDTDSHIDTLARMAPDNIILYTGCRDMDDDHFEELLKMRAQLSMFRNIDGEPYNLVELPFPSPIFDENGERLPATYANYLVTDKVILMPTYAQPENDMLALQTVKIAFPNHKVIGVDCRVLIRQHGSLHCSTMQVPFEILSPALFD